MSAKLVDISKDFCERLNQYSRNIHAKLNKCLEEMNSIAASSRSNQVYDMFKEADTGFRQLLKEYKAPKNIPDECRLDILYLWDYGSYVECNYAIDADFTEVINEDMVYDIEYKLEILDRDLIDLLHLMGQEGSTNFERVVVSTTENNMYRNCIYPFNCQVTRAVDELCQRVEALVSNLKTHGRSDTNVSAQVSAAIGEFDSLLGDIVKQLTE